ncbi:SulP family inorganic anion transporter [Tsukamurella spumae]|uniref:SulP family inorganic anion transporter n=1 Tax=Tsukamurella spumae TaxID=44753 RepID=A0A846X043_9ACTN|nr:SulP family inorganic anion transporter [Tsukamurella spumae]
MAPDAVSWRERVWSVARGPLPRPEDLPSRADYAELPRTWRGDLVAGVTVGVVALPLALAFGVSAGVGAEAGLITAIIAGVCAAVFGGSNVQVSGPTGAMVVVLAPIVASSGVGTVALLSVLAGVVLFLLGAARVGRAVGYIPWPVIEGFTAGIGVIIFLQQVPSALSSPVAPGANALTAAVESAARAHWPSAGVSAAMVLLVAVVMIAVPRVHRALPAGLIAIAAVTTAVAVFDVATPVIGALPSRLPAPHLPAVEWTQLPGLTGAVLAIAALAAIESLLSARVASTMPGPSGETTGPFNADRELVGQGVASIAAGMFGGMPATGAIARTAVNVRSGGRTRVAAIVHSIVLVIVVYAASTVVGRIPLAALAGVLMVTAARMVSPSVIRRILRSTRSDALTFVATAIITVSFDLIVAIEIGIACAALLTLRKFAGMGAVRRERLPGAPQSCDDQIALLRLDGLMFFGAADRIQQELTTIRGVKVIVLRLSQVQYVDATGAQALAETVQALERQGVTVLLKGIRPEHLPVISRVGVLEHLRHERHLFTSLDAAVAHAREHVRRSAHENATNGRDDARP